MPSIPQSLLWISLVVLWLFVLVPMLVNKRAAVRRTSDVALATRVLNSGTAARLIKRGRPAAGHRSDPDWRPAENDLDEDDDFDEDDEDNDVPGSRAAVVSMAAASVEETEPDYLDVEVVDEERGALPVGDSASEATPSCAADEHAEPVVEDESAYYDDTDVELAVADPDDEEILEDLEDQDADQDGTADQYEYVDDTSGIAAAEEPPTEATPRVSRRHRFDSSTAAAVSARKYAFRKRVLMTMALMLVVSAAAAFLLLPAAWWCCASIGGLTVLYLGYLRRQTRIEERVRRRRMQRMARSRLGVENTSDREFEVVPSRLRRPGAVVLEIDDADPIFDHLDYAPYSRDYRWERDLPRAAGQ
ncbi:MAG: hypothetical protein J2P17_07895 [Mycobacterium sp.]|nr:hypothetical protein [Mycobacterium sp.]